jgi:hypothetical protein
MTDGWLFLAENFIQSTKGGNNYVPQRRYFKGKIEYNLCEM